MLQHLTIPLAHMPSTYVLFLALLSAFDFCATDRLVMGLLAAGMLAGEVNEKASGSCGVSAELSGLLGVGKGGGRCAVLLSLPECSTCAKGIQMLCS